MKGQMSTFIYGRNPIREHLRAELPVESILIAEDARGAAVREIEQLARQRGIAVQRLPRELLTKKVGHEHHQGVIAVIAQSSYVSIQDILDVAKQRNEPNLVALLDNIQDPHNFGAIIRSADGAGVHGIIIPKDRAVGLTPAVQKASAGAAAYTPIAQVTNLARTMDELKKAGLWLIGTAKDAEQTIYEADLSGPLGIVLGSEGKGMRRLVREKCDFLVRIPMYGKVDSLNVSVTAALMFYEVKRRREKNRKK